MAKSGALCEAINMLVALPGDSIASRLMVGGLVPTPASETPGITLTRIQLPRDITMMFGRVRSLNVARRTNSAVTMILSVSIDQRV